MIFKLLDGRENLFQWDLNRKLIISDLTVNEVHFCNKTSDCSLVVEVYEKDGLRLADIPNILLQTDWTIKVYAYCGDCYTKESATFKVLARTRPDDYIYTETEVKRWEDLEQRVDTKITELDASEGERAAAEEARLAAEDKRTNAENERAAAEETRIAAEDKRKAAEETRAAAELERQEGYSTFGNRVQHIEDVAINHEKRITNLEAAALTYIEDNSIDYEKAIPDGIAPYALLKSIGGASKASKNILNPNEITSNKPITVNEDGSITVIDYAARLTTPELEPGTYYLAIETISGWINIITIQKDSSKWVCPNTSFTLDEKDALEIELGDLSTQGEAENFTLKIAIFKGSAKQEFEPFYSGFKDAAVEEIEVIGKNLLPNEVDNINNWDTTKTNKVFNIDIEKEGIYALSTTTKEISGIYFYIQRSVDGGSYTSSGAIIKKLGNTVMTSDGYFIGNTAIDSPMYFEVKKGHKFRLWLSNGTQELLDKVKGLQIERSELGAPATEYVPYSSYSIEMPEAVKALEGYGKGINENFYNYISVENGRVYYHKVIDECRIENATWKTNGDMSVIYNLFVTVLDKDTTKYISRNILSDRFDSVRIDSSSQNIGIDCYPSNAHGGFVIAIRPENVTSFTQVSFNEYMAARPFTAYVALKNPVITDITHLFPKDSDIFKVEGKGTLRFVNTEKMPVPSTIAYVSKKEG